MATHKKVSPTKPATIKKASTRKPRAAVAPDGETKSERFIRLAEARVNKAIKMIQAVGKLGGANYEKTEEQVQAIELAMTTAVQKAVKQLQNVKENTAGFKFG